MLRDGAGRVGRGGRGEGSAAQRGLTLHALGKDNVHEVAAVVDVQAARCPAASNLGMNFGQSAFDADRGRVARCAVTFGDPP